MDLHQMHKIHDMVMMVSRLAAIKITSSRALIIFHMLCPEFKVVINHTKIKISYTRFFSFWPPTNAQIMTQRLIRFESSA